MWQPSILTPTQLEERRREVGRLFLVGQLTQAEIARHLGVSRRAVCSWAKQLRDNPAGLKVLQNRPRTGRPARLSDAKWHELLEYLRGGAFEAGFETDRWTLDRIRVVIRRRFGVTYHPHYVAERLKALGWSPQLPQVVAKERDEELVLAWLAQDRPRIKKKARRQGAEIVFVDETGFSFRTRIGLTWAPQGQTPVLRRVSKRRELSTIIGLTASGHLVKRHSRHAFHGVDVVLFLKQLRRRFRSPLIIVWDRLSAHKSREVKDYLASARTISVEWLPPYAPDLNPEECCHGNAKQHLRNAAPEDEGEIRRQADREFARIGRDHELLISFFRHAGISVKPLT